jgi:DNA polymerase sigma
MHHTNVSIRFSEYEGLKKMNMLFNKIKWLWVDNFTKINLEKKFFLFLKKQDVKICIVSPELVKKERIKEINNIISKLKKNHLKIDAVCTKQPKLWLKYY